MAKKKGYVEFNTQLTEVVAQQLGTKFCFRCAKHRKLEGGNMVRTSNGVARFVCRDCAALRGGAKGVRA